jgi:hypothetical protein
MSDLKEDERLALADAAADPAGIIAARVRVNGASDAAGYEFDDLLQGLVRRGLMRWHDHRREGDDALSYRYQITDPGRAALLEGAPA